MSAEDTWKFQNRWVIEGVLTTDSFLHIGNGEKVTDTEDDNAPKPNAIITDHEGKPLIPGSTIKGNLRSWMEGRFDGAIMEKIFGTQKVEKGTDVKGGRAEFHCAYLEKPPTGYQFPEYDEKTVTDLTIGIAIDRRTGTVSDKKLFHQLVVPPGTIFKVQITGQNIDEQEVTALLKGLEGFNGSKQPLTLGSGTADGWGKFDWSLKKVGYVGKDEILAWLNSGTQSTGYAISGRDRTDEFRKIIVGKDTPSKHDDHALLLEIELHFSGMFLVNDPARLIKDGNDKTPDHMPRVTKDGKALLPASSFRGAFRSQAERIVRTVDKKACLVDDTASRCKPIFSKNELEKLCIACRTFGAAGWKTPIEISDFVQINGAQTLDQEFVAIDRFTGGGRDGAKFNAQAFVDPILKGSISIDTSRISQAEAGLLALTLRDLIEGDITFGFGSAKGYGSCMAKVVSARLDKVHERYKDSGLTAIAWKADDSYSLLHEAAAKFVKSFCEVVK